MNSRIALFLLLLLGGPLVLGGPSQLHAQAPPATGRGKMAWTVKPANGGPDFVIVGSVAFLGVQSYPLPEYVQDLYANSGTLLVETDFKALDQPKFTEAFNSRMQLPAGKNLKGVSSKVLHDQLTTRLEDLKIEPAAIQLEALQPWAAGMRVFGVANAKLGLESRYSLDRAMQTMALVDEKPLRYLDTPEQVLTLLTTWPEGAPEEDFARQLLAEQNILAQNLSEMRAAWTRGDLAFLQHNLLRSYEPYPALHQRMIGGRAADWAERLGRGQPLPQNTLAVLPLIYLVGENGLLAKLEASGCTVRRME